MRTQFDSSLREGFAKRSPSFREDEVLFQDGTNPSLPTILRSEIISRASAWQAIKSLSGEVGPIEFSNCLTHRRMHSKTGNFGLAIPTEDFRAKAATTKPFRKSRTISSGT